MIILLIVLLWIISIALRITSSGVKTVNSVSNKVSKLADKSKDKIEGKLDVKKDAEDVKIQNGVRGVRKTARKAKDLVVKATTRVIGAVRIIIDWLRRILLLILPEILLLDLIVFLVLVVIASSVLLFYDKFAEIKSDTSSSSSSQTVTDGGKSKLLIIGDSRTVLLGTVLFGLSDKDHTIKSSTDTGDYIYAKGAEDLSWVKDNIKEIDDLVDGDTAVMFNMGVNDVANRKAGSSVEPVSAYVDFLNDHYKTWKDKGADVYFVSTGPTNDEAVSDPNYKINSEIKEFNKGVKEGMNSEIGYVDIYSAIESDVMSKATEDGIHYYGKDINQKIYDEMAKHKGSGSIEKKSKVLIIGDSRMVGLATSVLGMSSTKSSYSGNSWDFVDDTKDNIHVYAMVSMGLSWTKSNLDEINGYIDSDTAVVFAMGANDLSGDKDGASYIEFLNDQQPKWAEKGASVFFASETAIDESKYTGYSNSDVENFNSKIKSGVNSKVGYIDLYSATKDMIATGDHSPDGLHYDSDVYEKMLDSIKSSAMK